MSIFANLRLRYNTSLLHKAIEQSNFPLTEKLANQYTLLSEKNSQGNTALHLCVIYNQIELVKVLLTKKLNLNH